jgi:predicted transcriptional regulator
MKDRQYNAWLTSGERFTIISETVLRDSRLNAKDLAVYQALVAHANFKTGRCSISKKTIAEWARSSERSVYDSVRKLIELGYINKEVQKINNTTIYWLNEPPVLSTENDIRESLKKSQSSKVPATVAYINGEVSATVAYEQKSNTNKSVLTDNSITTTIVSSELYDELEKEGISKNGSLERKEESINKISSLIARNSIHTKVKSIAKPTTTEILNAFIRGSGVKPKTDSEKAKWMEACWELRRAGHSAKQVQVNSESLVRKFSNANYWNPMALSRWWSTVHIPLVDNEKGHIADYNAGHFDPKEVKRWHVLTDEDKEFIELQKRFVEDTQPFWVKNNRRVNAQ